MNLSSAELSVVADYLRERFDEATAARMMRAVRPQYAAAVRQVDRYRTRILRGPSTCPECRRSYGHNSKCGFTVALEELCAATS